ncbi:MAG: hypothetical protein ACRDXB_10825, partial [Actinomycetes bacterium]
MATWTNLFDLGECTVTVLFGGAQVYSAVMGKGSSSALPAPYASSTIAIDAEGSVSLSNADADGSREVRVVPSYAHDYAARVRAVSFSSFAVSASGAVSDIGSTDFTAFTPVAAPDPLDLTNDTAGRDYVGVSV